jgi:hypothetical protein
MVVCNGETDAPWPGDAMNDRGRVEKLEVVYDQLPLLFVHIVT